MIPFHHPPTARDAEHQHRGLWDPAGAGVGLYIGRSFLTVYPGFSAYSAACFHVVAEAGDKERARALAEEFRDKIAGWRRDTA